MPDLDSNQPLSLKQQLLEKKKLSASQIELVTKQTLLAMKKGVFADNTQNLTSPETNPDMPKNGNPDSVQIKNADKGPGFNKKTFF